MDKIIVVGGVAAGASTAARLRRLNEKAEIIMFERGEDISFANCGLPYYINGTIPKRNHLLIQTPTSMLNRFNIDVRTRSEVKEISKEDKQVKITNLINGESYWESYDFLVLCPGASPYIPPIPGINKGNVFSVRNIPDSDQIKHYIETTNVNKAVVLGGGFIGMEMIEILIDLKIETTLIEADSQVIKPLDKEMSNIVHKYLQKQGVNLVFEDLPVSLEGNENLVEEINLSSGRTVPTDLVILGTGVRPETWLAEEAGLTIGSTGGILVDEYLQTSDPFIYAAGDAIQVKDYITGEDTLAPLAGPANRQGWIIGNNIAGRKIKYTGSQGTGILKVMDMTVAFTGQNEKQLKKLEQKYLACHAHPNSHATYYPGSTPMTIKLIFTPDEGKILGAQIVGYDGVDKRIDVLATSIRAGFTVFDLQELELAYAPPYSSAKDPVNMIAYAAGNMINEDVEVIHWPDVESKVADGAFLLDVRSVAEVLKGIVPGAYHISVDEIREHLDEIPRDREVLVYCQVGLRSYIASRILCQNGFKVKNISGGYTSYLQSRDI